MAIAVSQTYETGGGGFVLPMREGENMTFLA